jgi:hypothetical protein
MKFKRGDIIKQFDPGTDMMCIIRFIGKPNKRRPDYDHDNMYSVRCIYSDFKEEKSGKLYNWWINPGAVDWRIWEKISEDEVMVELL